jgi:hypothetical protein
MLCTEGGTFDRFGYPAFDPESLGGDPTLKARLSAVNQSPIIFIETQHSSEGEGRAGERMATGQGRMMWGSCQRMTSREARFSPIGEATTVS